MLKIECLVFGEETEREETAPDEVQEVPEAGARTPAEEKVGKSAERATEDLVASKMAIEENPLDQDMVAAEKNALGCESQDQDPVDAYDKEKRTQSQVDFQKDQEGQKEDQSTGRRRDEAHEKDPSEERDDPEQKTGR